MPGEYSTENKEKSLIIEQTKPSQTNGSVFPQNEHKLWFSNVSILGQTNVLLKVQE